MKKYVFIYGGLGNQLFQLAFARSLQNWTGARVELVDMTNIYGRNKAAWELDRFGFIPNRRGESLKLFFRVNDIFSQKTRAYGVRLPFSVMNEDIFNSANFIEDLQKHQFFSGYWQGECFFNGSLIYDHIVSAVNNIKLKLPDFGEKTIGVHVRRGDYVSDMKSRSVHLVCDQDWYSRAINSALDQMPNARLIFFSDDIEWARLKFSHFSASTFVTRSDDPFFDLAAYASCKYQIMSNSSYSWWGQYMNRNKDKKIFAPGYWFVGVKTVSLPIFNKNWVIVL